MQHNKAEVHDSLKKSLRDPSQLCSTAKNKYCLVTIKAPDWWAQRAIDIIGKGSASPDDVSATCCRQRVVL